jgi:hypothetical protein
MRTLRWLRKALWPADPLAGLDVASWLAEVRAARPEAVALVVPKWIGVTSATSHLFRFVLPIEPMLTRRAAARLAWLLRETGAPRVVFGTFTVGMLPLIDELVQARPQIELFALYHSNLLHQGQETNWQSLRMLMELARSGKLQRIGFVKAGMAELFQRMGIAASFVCNAVYQMPEGPAPVQAGGPHLGIWAVNAAVWQKLPFAMLGAAREIPGARVYMSGGNRRVVEFAGAMGVDAEIRERPFPPSEMPDRMRAMHLNLYVTLSECTPMVPLESLSVGVPCLFGPNSHLLEDHRYLHDRLMVPYPDRHEVIARYIRRALEERDEIIKAYRAYLPRYLDRSRQTLADFLGYRAVVARAA